MRALVVAGHDVALVVTGADQRRGRKAAPSPSPVKAAALELQIPVSERVGDVVELDPPADLGVVVAFGQLVRPEVLDRLAMVNVHFSLLARWRGAAPVERAILAGDEVTGVCIMALEEGLDTGPVYARAQVAIGPDETAAALRGRLGAIGTRLLLEVLDAPGELTAQVGEATYAAKLSTGELEIDWSRTASEAVRLVRAGRAWTTWRQGRLIVHRARAVEAPWGEDAPVPGTLVGDLVATGEGAVRLLEVQGEGRAAQELFRWAAGARPQPGEALGR